MIFAVLNRLERALCDLIALFIRAARAELRNASIDKFANPFEIANRLLKTRFPSRGHAKRLMNFARVVKHGVERLVFKSCLRNHIRKHYACGIEMQA